MEKPKGLPASKPKAPKSEAGRDAIAYPVKPDAMLDKHPEKLVEFFQHYVAGMDPAAAWVAAGYSENTRFQAKARIRENWLTIQKLIDERIGSQVPLAISVVVDIMMNSTSAQTRLMAAKDILSRAGKDKPIQIETSKKPAEKMEEVELEAEIIELAKKIGLKDLNFDKGNR